MPIENLYLEVNGTRQFVSLRAASPGLPLLLYLHGGPGDAALPLVARCNRPLQERYTVAIWEQRGSGKSYAPFSPDSPPAIQTFVEDIRAIALCLLQRLGRQKLYLWGHSWGSVLGLRFIRQYPQLVQGYIGCGQVVDMPRGARLQYDYVLAQAQTRGDAKTLARLSGIDPAYQGEGWLKDLLFVTRQTVHYGGSLYGASSYNRLVKSFLFFPGYSLQDLLNRQKGALQSIRFLWPELMRESFARVTSYEVPVLFVEGRHDHHVSSALAEEYFHTITSPKRLCWFEHSCHFPQWSEANQFNRLVSSLV